MFVKSKVYVIAGSIDDSIKAQVANSDVSIFKTFVDFERYVNDAPVVIDTLVISAKDLPFSATNMARVITISKSPFVQINGNIVYLIDENTKYSLVNDFIEMRQLSNWAVYQGNLSVKFITNIISGVGRQQVEGLNEIVTYRVRASEYIKQQNIQKYESESAEYYTDEDILKDIPEEIEQEDIKPTVEQETITNYIVGPAITDRAVMVFLLAQYMSLREKTLIVEKDVDFHTLTEIVTKSELDYEYIDITDLLKNITDVVNKVLNSPKHLIVIGSKLRTKYDYNFIMDVLQHNLEGRVPHIIRECNFNEIPYGRAYTIVIPNIIPEILKYCNEITEKIDSEKVTFVGVQSGSYGPLNLSSAEMKSIVESVLSVNGIAVQTVHINNIKLRDDEVVYDVLSVLNRGNK